MARMRTFPVGGISGLVLFLAVGSPLVGMSTGPLLLSKDGRTDHVIVISTKAHEAEVWAAEELARFLGKMTGRLSCPQR